MLVWFQRSIFADVDLILTPIVDSNYGITVVNRVVVAPLLFSTFFFLSWNVSNGSWLAYG